MTICCGAVSTTKRGLTSVWGRVHAGHMFDRVSLVMLCTMTFSFLIPYIVSLIPWPASWLMAEPQPCYYPSDWQALGGSSVGHGGTLHQDRIPPRPAARVVGPAN